MHRQYLMISYDMVLKKGQKGTTEIYLHCADIARNASSSTKITVTIAFIVDQVGVGRAQRVDIYIYIYQPDVIRVKIDTSFFIIIIDFLCYV
jgi:hypothetical protein